MPEEPAWVIERYTNSELFYWCGRAPDDFRRNHEDAIRFARQEDAMVVLAWICRGQGCVAQHIWMAGPGWLNKR